MKPKAIKRLLIFVFFFVFLFASLFLVFKPTNIFKKAFGVKANLVVDMSSSYDTPSYTWRNLAQGGEEMNSRMIAPVVGKIKALGPQYIRIDHVFDGYDVVKKDGGNLIFNWARLDLTLDDIAATGAKPFISLSYMPPAISRGDITDLPQNWSEWETVVQKLIEHISGERGVVNVYYEVWNEPDLFGKFKVYGDKDYLDLYYHTAMGAAKAGGVKAFKLGGPATTALYSNWLESLLKYISQSGARFDFFSWHRYSKDLDVYENDLLNAKKWLNKYPQFKDVELVISETGPNSENDEAYDNYFGAIHAIATSVLLENEVGKLFHFEIKDGPGPEKFWGRWGLFTHEKWGEPQAKPRYSAIAFLNRVRGGKVNVAGEGSWVKAFAKEEAGVVRIIVVNYDSVGSHGENVPISLINLKNGKYLIRRTDYGGAKSEVNIEVKDNSWLTNEFFKPNTAAIFEIIPL